MKPSEFMPISLQNLRSNGNALHPMHAAMTHPHAKPRWIISVRGSRAVLPMAEASPEEQRGNFLECREVSEMWTGSLSRLVPKLHSTYTWYVGIFCT